MRQLAHTESLRNRAGGRRGSERVPGADMKPREERLRHDRLMNLLATFKSLEVIEKLPDGMVTFSPAVLSAYWWSTEHKASGTSEVFVSWIQFGGALGRAALQTKQRREPVKKPKSDRQLITDGERRKQGDAPRPAMKIRLHPMLLDYVAGVHEALLYTVVGNALLDGEPEREFKVQLIARELVTAIEKPDDAAMKRLIAGREFIAALFHNRIFRHPAFGDACSLDELRAGCKKLDVAEMNAHDPVERDLDPVWRDLDRRARERLALFGFFVVLGFGLWNVGAVARLFAVFGFLMFLDQVSNITAIRKNSQTLVSIVGATLACATMALFVFGILNSTFDLVFKFLNSIFHFWTP